MAPRFRIVGRSGFLLYCRRLVVPLLNLPVGGFLLYQEGDSMSLTLAETVRLASYVCVRTSPVDTYTLLFLDGKRAYCGNGFCALSIPHPSDIKGGFPAHALASFLSGKQQQRLRVEDDGEGSIVFRSGRSRFETNPRSLDLWNYCFPKRSNLPEPIDASRGLLTALRKASISIGDDARLPWAVGAGIVADSKEQGTIWSTDNLSITRATFTTRITSSQVGTTANIHPDVCKLSLKISEDYSPHLLFLGSDFCEFRFADGIRLHAPAMRTEAPKRYVALTGDVDRSRMVVIPDRFKDVVQEAAAMVSGAHSDVCMMSVNKKGDFVVEASGTFGKIKSRCKPSGTKKHSKVSVRTFPKLVLRALDFSRTIHIADDRITLEGENFTHYVGTVQQDG